MRIFSLLGIILLFFQGDLRADASPPCFRYLENTFFDRVIVTEALSYMQIQQGLWELIIIDLRTKTPYIHRELLSLAAREKRNPLNYPFQMTKSKDLLQKVLFKMFQQTMRTYKYTFVREADIADAYRFIMDKHQVQWDLCR